MEPIYKIIPIRPNTWCIDEGHVRCFLLVGTQRALLIDSGMHIHNARDIAQRLTDLPISLLNTHADIDHIGSNAQFDKPYLHPDELENYGKTLADITPVTEGQYLDLGGRVLEVVELPGHTPGSIAVLDVEDRSIYTGDPVQDGSIFLFGPQRDLISYHMSLCKLYSLSSAYDRIYPSHGSYPVTADLIPALFKGCERVITGEAEYTKAEMFGTSIRVYDVGVAKLLCNA